MCRFPNAPPRSRHGEPIPPRGGGLDWTIPGKFQELRAQEKVAQELRKAARSGDLGRFFGKAADLRTRLTIAEARAQRLREQLDNFEVVPEYKELEREANESTREIDDLNVENVMDGDLLQQLRASLSEEDAPDLSDVTKLYAEAGVLLPDIVRRRFDEVERFHRHRKQARAPQRGNRLGRSAGYGARPAHGRP